MTLLPFKMPVRLDVPALFEVPVDPDAPDARRWVIEELSKPEYRAAEPTPFDRFAAAVRDWLGSLTLRADGSLQAPVLILVALIVIGAIVAAFFIFGSPRMNRRSAIVGALFGEHDVRDAAAMRRAAESAASDGEWAVAIEEVFRSIARGLAERTILSTTPGTTARAFAVRAGHAFPAEAGRLAEAATVFDEVRYLGGNGSQEEYRTIAKLEADLRSARPVLAEVTP